MSSVTNVETTPPPPPESVIRGTGQTKISLREMFGPTIGNHLSETLTSISTDFEGFAKQLGLEPASEAAQRLCWKKIGILPSGAKEYTMSLSGKSLPPELRSERGSVLNVQLLVGAGVLQVRHDYQSRVVAASESTDRVKVQQALKRTIAQTVNPLIATTVSLALKQKAEQKLKLHLKQKEGLRTQVNQRLTHQTTGLVRAVINRR